ncbi:unnamed protein product [Adineta steineri]|uniref:Non-specific serine/threonine protein kinase n=1 Tax=Adineta steineri TaxID=433720 RepID=A0A818QMR1_9BILA|nr:unnamed protein product [Adineta steineri]CAF3636921.1 unnamed protein product [Adineta steineri]
MHDSLICPITFDLFRDPVVAEDGHSYEREAIINWIRANGTSPLTREPLTVGALRPNHTLKKLVDEFETASRSKNFQFKLGVDVKTKSHRALFQTFGKTIYEAEWIKDNDSRPRIVLLKINGARAKKEASFYVDLTRHPSIVRTFGLVHSDNNEDDQDTQNSVTLLQELAPEGSLYEVLQHIGLNENILQAMFLQITDAMIFLAHNGIIHGDLACRNVLVFRLDKQEPHKNIVKLTDFGISRHSKLYAPTNSTATTTINIVPTRYAAPEVLANEQYSEKSDVYSIGVLMWEAYSKGKIPWSQSNSDAEVKRQSTCRTASMELRSNREQARAHLNTDYTTARDISASHHDYTSTRRTASPRDKQFTTTEGKLALNNNPTLLASLAALHHLLGSMDNKNKNYRAARFQFEELLKLFLSFTLEDNQILSATYSNIGSMFCQDDQHEQAIISMSIKIFVTL